jgi:tRNA-(ms[2]io[6]A)-hydroxylase
MIPLAPTSDSWVRAALGDLPTLLVDHAHCEKKAAHTAVGYIFTYPEWPSLVHGMSRLAREELVHFERVLKELERRGLAFRPLQSASYAAELFKLCRDRADEMLACALIEARSHERFVRLETALDGEPELRAFYAELAEAEARHSDHYVELAGEAAGGPVESRLAELARGEAAIVARPGLPLRMHAGG